MSNATTEAVPDIYDEAIAYLTKNPDKIFLAWHRPLDGDTSQRAKAHCLFQVVSPDGDIHADCGCLTQIRGGDFSAINDDWTKAIRADERIPCSPRDTKPSDLPVFAEWQRKLDARFPGRRESWMRRVGAK